MITKKEFENALIDALVSKYTDKPMPDTVATRYIAYREAEKILYADDIEYWLFMEENSVFESYMDKIKEDSVDKIENYFMNVNMY